MKIYLVALVDEYEGMYEHTIKIFSNENKAKEYLKTAKVKGDWEEWEISEFEVN